MTAAAGVRAAMFFCGENAAAKKTVADLLFKLGWDPVDVGGIDQALHLEHLTLMWIKMVRMGGASNRTMWARIDGGKK
jgi:predicted dinucleotide-binding enzyme